MKTSLTIIMAALVITSLSSNLFAEASATPNQIVGAMDWQEFEGTAPAVPGPWQKCGVVIAPTEPYETAEDAIINLFPLTLPCEEGAPWFYTVSNSRGYGNLVMMEADGTKHLCIHDGSEGHFTLEGLLDGTRPEHPYVFKLGPNHYRMYFWLYGNPDGKTIIRMIAAESTDLHHWKVINDGKAILGHHFDSTWGDLPARQVSNDAATIYRLPDGTWEFYSAAVTFILDDKSPYANKELCPGFVRFIMRWTSPDGIHLSKPEVVMFPDAKDEVATQFYYLTRLDLEPYTVGFFGDFNIQTQRVRIEPIWSYDHKHWNRPLRYPLWPEDYVSAATINDIVLEPDGNVSLYYNANNMDHNGKVVGEKKDPNKLYKAQVPARKFFGRQLQPGTVLASPAIRFTGMNPRLYVSEGAEITCEWQDMFSVTTKKVNVKIEGDIAEICLADVIGATATGFLRIKGSGIVYDAEY